MVPSVSKIPVVTCSYKKKIDICASACFLYQLDPSVTSNSILFMESSDLVERTHCTVKTVHGLVEDRGIHWRKTFVDVLPVGKRGAIG